MKILLNKGRWGVVLSRYPWTLLGFMITWDYHEIILTINIATIELTIEFVHAGLHNKRWNKHGFGLHLDWSY